MRCGSVLTLLVLATTLAASMAQPGLGLPPAGVSGFARGKAEDVRRVGALIFDSTAKSKFREPLATAAVVDREFLLTFHEDSAPETVTRVARSIQNSASSVQLKYVGNYEHGWKGLALKVPHQSAQETAALLERLLLIPDVRVGEANMIITKARPPRVPRVFVDLPNNGEATKPNPKNPQALPACVPLNNTDSNSTSHQASPQNWGLDRVGTRNNTLKHDYEYASTGKDVNVFVVDTGVQFNHPEIAGRAFGVDAGGFDAFGGDASDGHGHGTHCSGIVAGSSTGIAKDATIYSVRVLDEMGSGTIDTLINGLNYVANSNKTRRIASMSLGGGLSSSLNTAVEAATKAGVLVIVAAGNENMDACDVSPASSPSAVTVGAVDVSDVRADFSNYGKCVDIFAPGVDIYSSTTPTTYASWSGTSMATPHVAGVAARLWSKGVCNTNLECAEAIRCLGTSGLVKGLDADSPNLLLFVPPGV